MKRSPLALPYLLGSALLVVIPVLVGAGLAVSDYYGFAAPRFSGLDNLRRAVADGLFWRSVATSLVIALLAVPLRMLLAVGAALLLARAGGLLGGTGRVAAYLPSVVPEAAWALLWLWLLNPLYGPLPQLLSALGLPSPGFLTEPWGARIALVLVLAFQIGEAFVVALAARRAIPDSWYDALEVEGASAWFTMTRLTLPVMLPLLLVLAVRDAVVVLQGSFVPALLVTGGGPGHATLTAPLLIWRRAFEYGELGYASTLSLILLALTALAVAAPLWLAARLAARQRR